MSKKKVHLYCKKQSVLKKLFQKLLFIIPLLGLILSYANGINTSDSKYNTNKTVFSTNKNNFKALPLFHEIEENSDCSDFFFEESELEDNFEFDWIFFNSNLEAFTSTLTEKQKLYNKTSFCLLQNSTPLYDLFCNWKHHLS